MVSSHVTLSGATLQAPPIVAELEKVFASLDDEPLISSLSRRRGPKGYGERTLWHCLLVRYYLGLPSTAAMIRTLEQNPWIASACGLPSRQIPQKAAFSKFIARLSKYNIAAKVKDVSRSFVRHAYDTTPGFGQRVALDSTTLRGWSNGGKNPKTDKDAGWSVKKNTHGNREYTFGFKLHLLVDCETEMPIAANVSAGNVNDTKRATNVLAEARRSASRFNPRFVMADAGYSSSALFHTIKRQYRAEPIIQINRVHKKLRLTHEAFEATPEWKALYAQRQAVERVFSRLKGQRSLNHIRVRGIRKVTIHCYLSLIAMQARGYLQLASQ